jgi:hypothetical protein
MCKYHRIKCRWCREKIDIKEIIQSGDFEIVPYEDKRGNYEWISYQCPYCTLSNIYAKEIKE